MVLDTIEKPEIKIGSLSLEESKKEELPFDPKRDITPDQWNGIITRVRAEISNSRNVMLERWFSPLKILAPEIIDDINNTFVGRVDLTASIYTRIKREN